MKRWQTPQYYLMLISLAVPLAFSAWMALLNNFAIDAAQFTGKEIGILQSLREIPGFLAFTVVLLLAFISEQRLALVSLFFLTVSVTITGLFPTTLGLYVTTVLMSIGFHYMETIKQSLTLQWIDKAETAHFLGKMMAVGGAASIAVYGGLWFLSDVLNWSYHWLYGLFGGLSVTIVVVLAVAFPQFKQPVAQHKKLILRKRYSLYYVLTFLSGARRQIFVVFAGFLMVEKYGYSVSAIALLMLVNHVFNLFFAPFVGRWIGRIGERRALTLEYVGLIIIFVSYALVESATVAAGLYIVDHFFFAFAIAIKTYFQKIADPRDMAATAGVSFSINHIAAVILPVTLGGVWLWSNDAVFYIGAGFAVLSLILSQLIRIPRSEGLAATLEASEVKNA